MRGHILMRQPMPEQLPARIKPVRAPRKARSCPSHRAWVRRHHCIVLGCTTLPIECAHVRTGTDGGIGLKPSDRYVVSLCHEHHAEQHRIGEVAFELRHNLELLAIAEEFARSSPHRVILYQISKIMTDAPIGAGRGT
jgi:hypothetical protein